jgi:AcrR family transcriptional regulator
MGEDRPIIDIMWHPERAGPPRRGRRQGLSVTQVLEAAIALADAEGLEALSMRRVAQELSVVPMTLYTYVPDKSALLELMLDRIYLQMPHAETAASPWRDRLAAVAEENRALYERHPWAAAMPASRPPLGPGMAAKYEHELQAFADSGLDDVTTDSALTFLLGFVQASARAAADSRAAVDGRRQSDEQWWAANGPVLASVFDAATYPTAARVGAAAGAALGGAFNADHAYAFGLELVLDGLEALIERVSDPHR